MNDHQRASFLPPPPAYRLAAPRAADPTRHLSPLAATLLVELRRLPHATLARVTALEVVKAQTRLCQEQGHSTSRLVRAAFAELLRSGDVVAEPGEGGV